MAAVEKHILKAAKENMVEELEAKIKPLTEELDELKAAAEESGEASLFDEEISDVLARLRPVEVELEELLRKKSRKKALKKSLEWKDDPKALREKVRESKKVTIRDNEALARVKNSHAAKRNMQYGDWLHEGALVKRKDSSNPLLVLSLRGNRVEVLDGATQRYYRAASLRPCEIDD